MLIEDYERKLVNISAIIKERVKNTRRDSLEFILKKI